MLTALLVIGMSMVSQAATKSDTGLALYQTGSAAQAIYLALDVPEQVEKNGSKDSGKNKTYKIGKNVLCSKEVSLSKGPAMTEYLCSVGFDSKGSCGTSDQ